MKKIVAFSGSPRKNGNSSLLLKHFLSGFAQNSTHIDEYDVHEINLKNCRGCLRCNIIGKCSLSGDDWELISQKIEEADVLVFASPIYFHHVTAPLKMLIDRFRSLVKVQITESGLIHTPHHSWKKDFVLLLSMGSSDDVDAKAVIDLFNFMTSILGSENKLHTITATRLAMSNQLEKSKEELEVLYPKLKLPLKLAQADNFRNKELLQNAFALGNSLSF